MSTKFKIRKAKSKKTRTSKIKVLDGERRQFVTGANRQSDEGKGIPTLCSPVALRRLSQHMQGGVEAGYDPRNWELGLSLCSILDSLLRHIFDELEGKTDEDHSNAIQWNAHIYDHTKQMIRRGLLPKQLDDRPNYIPKKCLRHPRYEGIKPPKTKCDICQLIYDNRKG